ncbi:hypothetical protein [Phytoactinopolyspora endophytica]|uniref:hypothetical protein n=1 Tax=Phytoactinopolyspora endophytica TaxID=1642495 RepID=UPI00101D650A|nr:hypothetical protein [Phytoactinopolyspora endophytica]
MYAIPTAAGILGVTPAALEAALQRGETIATLARACGLDLDTMTDSLVDAEVPDVEALATIAGFDSDDISEFTAEMRAYLVTFINDGEHVANAQFDRPALIGV